MLRKFGQAYRQGDTLGDNEFSTAKTTGYLEPKIFIMPKVRTNLCMVETIYM